MGKMEMRQFLAEAREQGANGSVMIKCHSDDFLQREMDANRDSKTDLIRNLNWIFSNKNLFCH